MTYEEAIKEFEYCIEENQGFMECRYASEEAYRIAIKALEKQIPKKPLKEICGDRCSVCGSWVWGFTDKRDFCGKCSQAIDWSDEE